jgi:hypothetical protein
MSAAPESVVNSPSIEAVALGSTAVTRRDFSGEASQTTTVIIIKP